MNLRQRSTRFFLNIKLIFCLSLLFIHSIQRSQQSNSESSKNCYLNLSMIMLNYIDLQKNSRIFFVLFSFSQGESIACASLQFWNKTFEIFGKFYRFENGSFARVLSKGGKSTDFHFDISVLTITASRTKNVV